jgi:glycine cleavage system transcriptional repressor
MTSFLVVTAIGTDRPGIVNELTQLATDSSCNIVDSRMAVFGNECTLILLLSGQWNAIARFEADLSARSAQLELITLIKRTSEHTLVDYSSRLSIQLQGQDAPGCIGKFTEYLAERAIDLSSLKTQAKDGQQQISMHIRLPNKANLNQLKQDFTTMSHQLNLTVNFED